MLQGMSDVTGSRAHQDMLDITRRPTSDGSHFNGKPNKVYNKI